MLSFLKPLNAPQVTPPVFSSVSDEAKLYLDRHGYCVLEVLTNEECRHARELLLSDFRKIRPSIDPRATLGSLTEVEVPGHQGLLLNHGITFAECASYVRTHCKVRKVFADFLDVDDDELTCSFDALAFSPRNVSGLPFFQREWLHFDKTTGIEGSDLYCLQSTIYLQDAMDEYSASIIVVPGSHKRWKDYMQNRNVSQHFVLIYGEWASEAVKLSIPSGAMVIWTSELAHQGGIGRPHQPPSLLERFLMSLGLSRPPTHDVPEMQAQRVAVMVSYGRRSDRSPEAERNFLAMAIAGVASTHWSQLGIVHPSAEAKRQAGGDFVHYNPPLNPEVTEEEFQQMIPEALRDCVTDLSLASVSNLPLRQIASFDLSHLRRLTHPQYAKLVPSHPVT